MANFNLERIRFRWKGDWTLSTDYVKDDVVRYQGKTYVCLLGHQSDANTIYPDLNLAAPNTRWELMFDGNQWRGDWVQNTQYNRGDLIKYAGYVYQCVVEHQSTNIVSQGPIQDIEKWTIVATTYNWLNTWTPSVANVDPLLAVPQYYNLGDVVIYNGITYICIQKHLAGVLLEANQSAWAIVTRSDNWRTNWTVSTRYAVDDIVKYGAISYRCLTGHTSAVDLENGLENDQSKWEIFLEGIEYKGNWTADFRYKKYDVVKSGGSLWRATQGHTSTTTLRNDVAKWEVYVPGLEYEALWDSGTEYNKGDIVVYGGYSYTALTNNTNSIPSVNGLLQDTGDWELLVAGYKHLGDWEAGTAYKTGEVIRDQGYLYIAVGDSTGIKPDTNTSKWQILVTGRKWKDNWVDNIEYHLGDVVTYAGVTYICISRHLGTESDNRPDLDIENTNENYWRVLIQGTPSNVLTTRGDIRTHDASETLRFAIGNPGNVLKSINGNISWGNFEEVPNVFYVSVQGIDAEGAGFTLNAPFRTVKYACEYVANNFDNDTVNTTIFIKTGIYEEQLPIKVPRNCALVGDELRSTVITPDAGSISQNMFYVNNGSGIRNMTLQGLTGTLGAPNQYLTRRPSAGAFVSLDPGTGPDDESVWIISKSCYVQNVSTFGTGCIGMKIDGSLHNGGNRSVVANDFTQILSDGIGYWALNGGRSELVSVFTYFCHIGYLAENGGILRATNGNNSYGTFGSVAEGFDATETPITAEIDNRTLEAQVNLVHTDGSQIIGIAYSHAGQSYTSASGTISGTGINAALTFEEFRNNAISQIRLIDPADSSTPGGLNYQYLLNNAQSGDSTSITLAASDNTGTAEKYVGMRIFLDSGKGIGQYAYISSYDSLTKIAIVSRESDGASGWDHIYPGWPVVATLDTTTRYRIEPAVNIAEPTFGATPLNAGLSSLGWKFIVSNGAQEIIAVSETLSQNYAYSTNAGVNWSETSSSISWTGGASSIGVVYTGTNYIIASNGTQWALSSNPASFVTEENAASNIVSIATDKNGGLILVLDDGTVEYSTDHGATTLTATGITGAAAYGNGKYIIVASNGDVAYSTNNGATWTTTASAVSSSTWKVTYGSGRFAALGSTNKVAYSFDGITWYENIIEDEEVFDTISYGAGIFIATGNTNKLAKSQDGNVWKTFDDDSTTYSLNDIRDWGNVEYITATGNWIAVATGSVWNTIQIGATAFARVNVSSSRIQDFIIYNPGSNYTSDPLVSIYDPESTVDVDYQIRKNNGVLAHPVFSNRGEGYITATMTVTGDGFADIYQSGKTLNLKNVSLLPGPGANVVINGIDDVTYRLTKVVSQSGSAPNLNLVINISPTITNQNSPEHEETIIIREQYSQVRLTGHDFLDIGVGNTTSTRYPQLYLEGEDPATPRQPFNETVDNGGGRVFYTSTDQDGNFRVGELFAVEQSTGTVTVNADLFELAGLTELSLGGIQVGGSAVVIKEFSKDGTFVANSNNIVPTQAAIITYLQSRISSGGADALTNALIAGQVRVTGNNITTTSGLQINIPVSVNHTKGIDGDYLAIQLFGI
jgi:hypothetical protein